SVISDCSALRYHPSIRSLSYAFDDQRYLHSLPTRRSSDLGKPAEGSAVVQQVTPEGAVTRESLVTPEQVEPTVEAFQQPGRDVRDRKSTRLNSSHVKISYAVFCLKKKWMRRSGLICLARSS